MKLKPLNCDSVFEKKTYIFFANGVKIVRLFLSAKCENVLNVKIRIQYEFPNTMASLESEK